MLSLQHQINIGQMLKQVMDPEEFEGAKEDAKCEINRTEENISEIEMDLSETRTKHSRLADKIRTLEMDLQDEKSKLEILNDNYKKEFNQITL